MAKEKIEKVKVSEIANELGKKSKDVIAKALEIGIVIKSANNSIESTIADDLYRYIAEGRMPDSINKKNKEAKNNTKSKEQKETNYEETKDDIKNINTKKKTTTKSKNVNNSTNKGKSKNIVTSSIENDISNNDNIIKVPTRKVIIVSKNNNEEEQEKKENTKNINTILSINDIKDTIKDISLKPIKKEKKKKENKKPQTTKHAKETKIDIERRLSDTNIEYEDNNEVMLIDLNEVERKIEEKEKIEERVGIQRNNQWFIDNIKRDGKRKRKKWNNDSYTQSKNDINNISNITIPDEIRVYEFADKLGLRVTDIIAKLFKLGEMVTKNDFLDRTMIEVLAQEFDIKITIAKATQELEYLQENNEKEKEMVSRPPVVTIMGHVDHGKTSLLDYIRKSKVTKTEHGGITQHIGAYMVTKNEKEIVFIDTPGHEAFANMRSRGAQITDIVIIVIAADDGVKQQTIEALSHAKDANVQIIIAMNKIDKKNANIDKLKAEMAEIGYNPSDWGGEYDFIPVSAKTGQGIDDLLDTILIQAEIMELKTNIKGNAQAIILEGSLDKGKGPVVTAIVKEGILKTGDSIVADTAYGKVRALIRDDGSKVDVLKPSQVALLTGLNEVPSAGAILVSLENESIAKEYAMKRKAYLRAKELSKSTKVSFDELSSVVADGKLKPLRLIIKADTQGSLEALKSSLETLSNEEIKVNIITSAVGSINENDINTAQSSNNCYILGFNVKPLNIIKAKAKELNVTIKSHSIIYNLIDDVKSIISSMMQPIIKEEVIGNVIVKDIFNVGKGNVIAGCFIEDGVIRKDSKIKLIRNGNVIHIGTIASLKRFKDDVKEVTKGYECGIMLENFNDIQVGDTLNVIKEKIKNKQYE